jgi:hypothetical protein
MNRAKYSENAGGNQDFTARPPLHPAEMFFDGRPVFPAHIRNLPTEIARIAVFNIAIGPGPDQDKRPEHAKTVAGCEGGSCTVGAKP